MGHPLFVLSETSAGFALFKAKDKKFLKSDEGTAEVQTAEGINELLKLKTFVKFDSAARAVEEAATIVNGQVSPMLAQLLDSIKDEKKASLAVMDPKLGAAINKLPGIELGLISDSTTNDLYRAIREHLPSLIPGLPQEVISTMSLGLSHSLSRHKLKFSPDKVDTMIVQAISLLDDLDKELNTYAMRVKEWYGWHFPEMGKIVNDNLAYAKIILKVGMRTNTSNTDLEDILPEEIETAIKAAAEVSMGTEITQEDLENIQLLAEQVVGFTEYRAQLSSYLSARMLAIAPNLTELVGELVGARLIAHAGSLMSLAKSPASTIQILGAEKALFRALKTKHDTPKYGLIYHASLVGQATGKNKGKIARMLAAKASIGIRVDALSDWSAQGEGKGDDIDEEERSSMGVNWRRKIERQLRTLEGKAPLPRGVAVGPNGKIATPGKWEVKEAAKYNKDADGLAGDESAAVEPVSVKKEKKEKKVDTPKKPLIEVVAEDSEVDSDEEMADADTISTVSENSPSPPASPAWESSILGNTSEAKKARKKERHERNEAMAAHKTEKRKEKKARDARNADREERRQKKALQDEKRTVEDPDVKNAAILEIDLAKYQKKLAAGQIKFEDGKPVYLSKKELKKLAKAAEAAPSKKRKIEDAETPEKKKKKSKA